MRLPFFYGWVIVGVAALATAAAAAGQTYTMAVFMPAMTDDLGITVTDVSTIYLFGSLAAAASVFAVGRSLDRFGSRRLLVAVGLMLGVGSLWMSRSSDSWQLLVGFAITRSMGQGALSLVPASLVSMWFIRRRANALALVSLGDACAVAVFPTYVAMLVDTVGWRAAWIGLGATTAAILVIPAALLVHHSPESVGLRPDGERRQDSSGTGLDERARRESRPGMRLHEAMSTRAMWMLLAASLWPALVGTAVVFHVVSLLTRTGVSTSAAASVLAVVAISQVVGQFLYAPLNARVPARHLIALGLVAMAPVILLLVVFSEPWQAYLFGVLFGLGMGLLRIANQAVWPEYFGREHLGSINGLAMLAMMMSSAVGPLPLALSLDMTGSYAAGLIAYVGVLPLCAGAALCAGPPERMAISSRAARWTSRGRAGVPGPPA